MWQYLFDPAVHWGEHEGEAESQGSVCGRVEEWPRFHEGDEDGEEGHKGDVQAVDNTAGLGAVAKGGTPTYPDGVDRLTKLLDRVKETKSAAAVGFANQEDPQVHQWNIAQKDAYHFRLLSLEADGCQSRYCTWVYS